MRWLDLWFADGDRRRLALAMVAWAWLLAVPVLVARWATGRFGKSGRAAWALLVLAALPLLGFSPGRYNGSDAAEELAFDAIGDSAAGEVGAVVAVLALLSPLAVMLLMWPAFARMQRRLRALPKDEVIEPERARRLSTHSPWTYAAAWTAFWALAAVLMVTTVDTYPTRGTWMATTAAEIAGGDDGVTGSFEVGLETSRAEVVGCDEAAALLVVDGEQPELSGCRTAMVVEAVGRTGEGAARASTGALAAVVLQTRTEGQLDRLDAALDDAVLVDALAGDVDGGDVGTLTTRAAAAYALVVAVEDPGEAPLGEGAAQRPLTRALAYVVLGTAAGIYLAPPASDEG